MKRQPEEKLRTHRAAFRNRTPAPGGVTLINGLKFHNKIRKSSDMISRDSIFFFFLENLPS